MAHAHSEPSHGSGEVEVVSVSDRNPKVRTIKVVRPEPQDASFVPATLKGLGITVKHFFKNVFAPRAKGDIETIEYPEQKKPYPERTRGLHRLMKREDGAVRCVACMCCPTVCPAHCITIIPAETDNRGIEKFPARFEIDELRCVVCGLCVEACPCDAIRMDTGMHAAPVETRADAIMTKEAMLDLGVRSSAVQGGIGADWRVKQPPKEDDRGGPSGSDRP